MKLSKLNQMREKVKEELEHIPDFPKPQKDLRMVYWGFRMNSLGKNAERIKTAEEVLNECIEYLRNNDGVYLRKGNNYKFLYDKEFFKKGT